VALVLDTPPKLMLSPAEWDALADTSGLELVDGMVHFMPSATMGHEHVKAELRNQLRRLRPPGIRITTELEIQLSLNHRRKPDVVAVQADAGDFAASTVSPSKVLLAVEVVSPGSETIDRKHKPLEYADAFLPHYWRIELVPQLEVHTFRLGDTGWVETGVWTAGDTIAAPGLMWAKIPVDALLDDF
jgi:Uma2 family endonuclease